MSISDCFLSQQWMGRLEQQFSYHSGDLNGIVAQLDYLNKQRWFCTVIVLLSCVNFAFHEP
ncbi:hypothetical protein PV04_00774 [Phialophora macrospora]|uniref:Uncharacterized protein n=1 Tax=Phialophora macrospora TaxID=1851006 RepID=A0A0D2FVV8_9EURO|nr:hypothetical protein PV04_00774 [Phialophora macrospora]